MGKRKSPNEAPNREKKWDQVFNALQKCIQNLQKDRELLDGKVKYLQGVVCKMKKEQKFESLKAELLLVSKEREAAVYKHRFENVEDDLAGFREFSDHLLEKCSVTTDVSNDVSNEGVGCKNLPLQNEVWKLKSEIENYKLEKNSEIAALLAEKNFVWNQLKKMEGDLTEKLKRKCDEVECANQKVQLLLNQAEELHMSNEKLRTDISKMESESLQRSEIICKLSQEIELLKSISGSASHSLCPCRRDAAASFKGGKNRAANGSVATVKKETQTPQTRGKITRTQQRAHKSTGGRAPKKRFVLQGIGSPDARSKRKADDVITIPDSPRLFNSSFKVPKLKS